MCDQGLRPAGCMVASVIRACDTAGEWRKGLEALRQTQAVRDAKPDPGSLSAAVEMCCHAGEIVRAFIFTSVGTSCDCTVQADCMVIVRGALFLLFSSLGCCYVG